MAIYIIDEAIDRMGGVERVVSTLANNLSKKDKVIVMSEFKSREEPFYKYNKCIERNYVLKKIDISINNISKKGIKFYVLKVIEKIVKRFTLKILLKKYIKNVKNDDVVIFARVQVALDFLPMFEKQNINPKIIVRDASTIECLKKYELRLFKKYFSKYVDKFIVSSDESMKNYLKFFAENRLKKIDMEKIYNPLGIVPKTGYNFESKCIVSLGRLHKQKGFDNLINSFSIVNKQNPDWKLCIYGFGGEEKNLRKIICNANLEDKVKILSPVKDVVSIFNNSAIFALTSRYEGYANTLVEAMACGIPCISYDWISGVDEIIEDEYNGRVVHLRNKFEYFGGINDKQDEKNYADGLCAMITNRNICNQYSKNSIKIIESRNFEKIIEKWEKIIKDLKGYKNEK